MKNKKRFLICLDDDDTIDFFRIKEEKNKAIFVYGSFKMSGGSSPYLPKDNLNIETRGGDYKWKIVSEKELVVLLMNHDRKKRDTFNYDND